MSWYRIEIRFSAQLTALALLASTVSPLPVAAQDLSLGKQAFSAKAGCPFCHGWAGDGKGDPRSEGGAPTLGGARAMRAALLHRVCLSIDQRLDEPDFCVSAAADANGISVRYLQKLFEEQGDTFAAYVRRRRLDHCRADLADPRHVSVSITSICFRWGFNDAASFSRAFSREYGQSPRQFRAGAVGRMRARQ